MHWQVTTYAIALIVSAGVSAVLAFFVWRWRAARGGTWLFFFLVAVTEWTLAVAFEAAVVGIPAKIFWSKVEYVGIVSSPVFFLAFTLEYAHQEKWLTTRNLVLLFAIPLITLVLAITNEWHHWIWTSFTPSDNGPNILIYGHGPWFWILVAYVYSILSAGALLLVRAALKYRHVYRSQAILLMLAWLFPVAGNVLYVFGWGPFPGQDLTPIAFALMGATLTVNMYQFRFLDLVPVARDALIENMADGVLVLDGKHRVLDINPAARHFLGAQALRVGDDLAVALTAWPEVIEACVATTEARSEIRLSGDSPRCLSIHVSALRDRRKRITGQLVVMRDITERKQAEEDRERLIGELQAALANVKTLRGLLPICANCKKVRDDEGYWRSVEEYVMEHSEAHFSHGICPDCMKKLYPWLKLGGQQ
jgi:PAS domain S-box-containing protein